MKRAFILLGALLAAFCCACCATPAVSSPSSSAKPPFSLSDEPVVIPTITVPPAETDLTVLKNTDVTFPAHNDGTRNTPADFVGANHIWASDTLVSDNSLAEGGVRMMQLGSRTIKTYLTNYYTSNYSQVDWPETPYASPLELADSPYYRQLFTMDIDTFVLGTYIFSNEFGHPATYFSQQFPEQARQLEYQQIYELTYYLCKKYEGSGKTFILQNWEGDWSCLPASENRGVPSQEIFDRMIAWCNTRQDAVTAARRDAGCKDVYVYHALEVNRVKDGMEGIACVTSDVIPYTYCDFYSYSAYDTEEDSELFAAALDYLSAQVASNRTGGKSQCYIGEFGYPNSMGADKTVVIAERVLRIAREKNYAHAYFWHSVVEDASIGTDGYWLVSPTGYLHAAWNTLYKFIHNGQDDPNYLNQKPEFSLPLHWQPQSLSEVSSGGLKMRSISYDGTAEMCLFQNTVCVASSDQPNQHLIYFDAYDEAVKNKSRLRVKVTVWAGEAINLSINYNATDDIAAGKTQPVARTGEWEEVTFTLRDADFRNGLQGMADLRFSAGTKPLYIRSVYIEEF